MKKVIILLLCLLTCFIVSCSEQYPTPEAAIKACIDAGGVPKYESNINSTTFTCTFNKNGEE